MLVLVKSFVQNQSRKTLFSSRLVYIINLLIPLNYILLTIIHEYFVSSLFIARGKLPDLNVDHQLDPPPPMTRASKSFIHGIKYLVTVMIVICSARRLRTSSSTYNGAIYSAVGGRRVNFNRFSIRYLRKIESNSGRNVNGNT